MRMTSRPPGPLIPVGERENSDLFDLGRNGSYLVVRELHQYVEAFWDSMQAAAAGLRRMRLAGERVVGRERDGTCCCRTISGWRARHRGRTMLSASSGRTGTASAARWVRMCAAPIHARPGPGCGGCADGWSAREQPSPAAPRAEIRRFQKGEKDGEAGTRAVCSWR
jgi:hypothetical protein